MKKCGLISVLSLFSLSAFLPAFAANQDLSQVQSQIKAQQQKLNAQRSEHSRLQQELKKHESNINTVLGELRKTEQELKEVRKDIAESDKQIARLEKQLSTQKQKLAEQLDAAYRAGLNPSVIERMLSDKAQQSGRMFAYYQEFNRKRMALIADIKHTQESLETQKSQAQTQQTQLQAILSKQKKSQSNLEKSQRERKTTLSKLDRSIKQGENRLDVLKQNEAKLKSSIATAEKRAREQRQREIAEYERKKAAQEKASNKPYQPTEQERQLTRQGGGLGAGKQQYAMPVAGTVANRYGSVQMGELRWKGLVINAPAGSPVHTIADGRVILADWLQGYGLVVLVDHGAGDMSLYGYNQRISVRNGQYVKRGQKIAEVGNTGGQGRSALYFEIRRKGKALNPQSWVR
ncbi:murein hydrolase activator EnvC [Spirabiliibacterium falconis]|uniref:murein hydrolase activator EnvC n=1 Tax=Spirabiliibacterium falconis TaxID=572023 RepID=UPI002E2BE011|nr:murein hydrolase activator EnvC [Spirabiliibacterium falconis]